MNRRTTLKKPSHNTFQNSNRAVVDFEKIIDVLPKAFTVITVFFGVAALCHEAGFYSALGLELSQIPISASDQFKNLLALIPSLVKNVTLISMIALIVFLPTQNEKFYKLVSLVFALLGLSFVGIDLLSDSENTIHTGFSFLILAMLLFNTRRELCGANKKIKFNAAIVSVMIFLPFWLFGIGIESATRIQTEPQQVQIFSKDSSSTKHEFKATLLRSYEKQILILTEEKELLFQPLDQIIKLQILNYSKQVNLPNK